MTGLKSIFITLLITSAFQLIGQVVTPPDARGSYWIAPENYYAVNARGTAHTNIPAPKAAPGDPIPLVSIECIGATAIYRVVGEEGSTYSWTITDDTGAPLSWANLTGTNFTETITTNLGGTSTTVTNYGSETTVLWPFTGNYSLEVTQYSVHSCKTIKVGEVQVYPQPEIRNIEPEVATCPNVPYYFVTAEALNYGSLTWTTSGDGTFDNRNIAKATYTPGTNDITNGIVVLTIAAAGLGDSPGCQTATATTTLKIKSLEADVFTSTITCNGLADGGIRLENIKNGSGNYSLFIDGNRVAGGSGMIIYNGLSQGTHSVMLRDDITGCEQPLPNIFIPEPDLLTATVDADPPTCKGNDGKINISNPQNAASELVGVPGNYMYSIENTNGTYSKSSDKPYGPNDSYTFGGLATGTYTVKIWDADHLYCVQTLTPTITLSDPDPLFVAATAFDVTCFDANDGTVSVTLHTGGSGNYQYQLVEQSTGTPWAKGWVIETELLGTVSPGNYSLQMRDANNTGCVVTSPDLFTINEPEILAGTTTSTDERCWNAKDGSVEVTASLGGHKPYSYIYLLEGTPLDPLDGAKYSSGWISNSLFDKLPPGTYDVWIGDAKFPDCIKQIGFSIVIRPALKLMATVTPVPVKCFGESNGEIVITVPINGKAPYQYSITNGNTWTTSTTITGLSAGTYTVTMLDDNGCSNELDPVEITEPPKLEVSESHNVETIAGLDYGTVSVTISGGTQPYEFTDNGGATWTSTAPDFALTNLIPATYTITIKDENECQEIIVVNLSGLLKAKPLPYNVSCNGGSDGKIVFTNVSGGSGVWQYSIKNGADGTWQDSDTFAGLPSGNYHPVVSDKADPSLQSSFGDLIISQPAPVLATAGMTKEETFAGTKDGEITLTSVSGGSGVYEFRMLPNNPVWTAWNGTNVKFSNLSKATYTLEIKDSKGCSFTLPVDVVLKGELAGTVSKVDPFCNGENGTITVSTLNTGVDFSFNDRVSWTASNPSPEKAGKHVVWIRDKETLITKNLGEVEIIQPNPLMLSWDQNLTQDPTCNDPNGYITLIVSGGTGPYYLSINNTVDYKPFVARQPIPAGEIRGFYLKDSKGCETQFGYGMKSITQIVYNPPTVVEPLCYGGTGTVTFSPPTGGVAPYKYTLKGEITYQNTTGVFLNLPSGLVYSATITDSKGCQSAEIAIPLGPMIPLTAVVSATRGSLCGGGVVDVNISASGGTAPYKIGTELLPLSKTINLALGTQTFTITDANGCTTPAIISPVAPPVLQVTSPVLACNDLFASLKIVQPYDPADPTRFQYSLDGGKTWTSTTIFNGLAINTAYKLRALDKTTQCISSEITVKTSDVSLPEMPVFYPLVIPTCLNPNGTITVKTPVNTGSRIYSYSIDGANYQTSPVFPNLVGTMTYTITVRDDISGCISSPVSIYVPAVPPPPVISVSGVSPKCYGEPYTITINALPVVSAGKTYNFDGVYTFYYDGGQFDNVKIQGGVATITGIAQQPTNFNNIRFEANGCPSTGVNINVKIDVPEAIVITQALVTENTLKGTQRGAIDLTVIGGSPKLSYAWISNTFTSTITTEDLNNMANGTYTVTITDANNCSITKMLKIPLNNPPVAVADKYLYLCTPLNENLLVNDFDPDPKEQNDSIIINTVAVISPKHFKTFQINADGTFNYEVQAGYSGTDVFVYEIADKFGQTATATVTIDIVSDFDGDGIPDLADADADGDGILNVDEVLAGQDWKTTDSDGDGHFNWLDIDSDNDGIVDNVEAQSTVGYIAPSGKINKDGLDLAYEPAEGGTKIVPVNTDLLMSSGGDKIPDFLDTDSDDDMVPDYIEGYDGVECAVCKGDYADGKPNLIISGKDTDADGLDDSYDNVINGCNNGNSTGSYATWDNVQDYDGDGMKDWRDDNDDDDEYLTRFEDLNADGDYSNDVTGHVGHPEYLWYGRDCELFIPDAFSPNNDNIHDYFQIYCIESYPNAHMYIFDQVGNKLYEKDHYGNLEFWKTADQAWWDGTTTNRSAARNGNKVVTGTYYYVLRLGNGDVKKSFVFVSY